MEEFFLQVQDLYLELNEAYGREPTSDELLQEIKNLEAAVLTEEEKLKQAACLGYLLGRTE